MASSGFLVQHCSPLFFHQQPAGIPGWTRGRMFNEACKGQCLCDASCFLVGVLSLAACWCTTAEELGQDVGMVGEFERELDIVESTPGAVIKEAAGVPCVGLVPCVPCVCLVFHLALAKQWSLVETIHPLCSLVKLPLGLVLLDAPFRPETHVWAEHTTSVLNPTAFFAAPPKSTGPVFLIHLLAHHTQPETTVDKTPFSPA